MEIFQVQILCPNGRRQNVKISRNAKLLQVLEEVCQKQKFLPADDYKLVQGRKAFDLTLSVRYSNLPNNAKLELVKAEKPRAETDVTIALQLENGERVQQEFNPGTSLWDILLFWENKPDRPYKGSLAKVDKTQSPSIQPVCVYLREEITGELALRETTLRSLGLTGGRAAIRLLHRPVEDQVLEDIALKIEKEKQRRAKLEQSGTATQAFQGTVTPPTDQESLKEDNVPMQQVTSSSDVITASQSNSRETMEQGDVSSVEPEPKVCRKDEDSLETNKVEHMDVEQPTVETHMETEDVAPSENTSQRTPAGTDAVQRLRGVPGIQVFTPDDFNSLSPQEQEIARRLAQSFFSQGGAESLQQLGASQKQKRPKQTRASEVPFANFKFPEETKGQNLYQNELSSVRSEEFQPCERKVKVFSLEEKLSQGSQDGSEAVPDDFFEITEGDLRSLLSAQRKRLRELEDQPLMTSAMRRAHLEAAYSRYKLVTIRVYFPDKLVLQGLFRPRETVFALKTFVRQHLEDRHLQFYCYTSPPKHVLEDDSQTLIEARLVPATVVYFGSKIHKDCYLSEEALGRTCSKQEADLDVAHCLNDTAEASENAVPVNVPSQGLSVSRSAPVSTASTPSTSSAASSSSSAASADKQVPKWFKVGKK